MGSFDGKNSLSDRIRDLEDIGTYFGNTPDTKITFDPASRNWSADIKQTLTLDYRVDVDDLYDKISHSLGQKISCWFWPDADGTPQHGKSLFQSGLYYIGLTAATTIGFAAGAKAFGLAGLVVGPLAGYISKKIIDSKKNIDYKPDGDSIKYEIETTDFRESVKAKAVNFGRIIKYSFAKVGHKLMPRKIAEPDAPDKVLPDLYCRAFCIKPTSDPRKYEIVYETDGAVPKRIIVKDMDAIWRGFVATQPKSWDEVYASISNKVSAGT
jgi:hypothetical protein